MGILLFILFTVLLLGTLARLALRRRRVNGSRIPAAVPAPPYREQRIPLPDDPSALEQKIRLEAERDFVFTLNEKLNISSDAKTAARHIVNEVRGFLNVEVCAVYLYDAEKDRLQVEAVAGVPDGEFSPVSLLKGESVTGEVARTRQPVIVNDLSGNAFFGALSTEQFLRNSFLSVPLIFQDEFIGVLNAAGKRSGAPFRESDLAFLLNVARVGAIAFKNSRLIAQMQKDYINTITTLALLIDARDPYTKRHSENVTRYAVAMARELKLPGELVELISRAGLLHDIGKIGIRDSVLLKPGKLTDEEFEQVKAHAARGAEIVSTLPALLPVAFLVRHHHERYDGRGYPDGKKGEEIELGARVLAVADTFDAMLTDRPYRKGMPLQDALAELNRCKGSQFDPRIVEGFLRALENDPGLPAREASPAPQGK